MTDSSDGRQRYHRGRGWVVPFAMTPEWVLDAPISDRAKVLYAMLSRYADDKGSAFPGRKRLAERLGVTLPTLDKAMRELIEIDALEVVPRFRADGGQTSNGYLIHFSRGSEAPEGGREESPLSPIEREPEGTRDARTPSGVLARQDENVPPPLTLVNGRNLAWDRLAGICNIDPASPRQGELATALNGRRGREGIRAMFWLEVLRWKGSSLRPSVIGRNPETFEYALAAAIERKAALYAGRMPPDSIVTPTALAKWWLDLERMEDSGGGLSAEGMRNLDA